MNRTLGAVCTAIIMSAAMLGAQAKSGSDSSSKASDSGKSAAPAAGVVTFTGCLNPGSKSDPFFLTSAKQKGVKGEATTVKLVPETPKVDLGAFVTHEVEVTGTVDKAGSTPTMTVTKVKSRNDQC